MPDHDDDAGRSAPDADQAAMDRWLEYREQQLRYDRDYLKRLEQSREASPPPSPAKPDVAWGHPVCDRCPRRVGCGLQRGMRDVEELAAQTEEPTTGASPASEPRTVALATLSPRDLAVAQRLAGQIDARDARCVLALGTKPQNTLATATKSIVGASGTPSAGDAVETLTELLGLLRDAETDSEGGAIGASMRRIPLLGGLFDKDRQTVGAYESIAKRISEIEARLHKQQMSLLKDYEDLDALFAENAGFIEQLRIYIAAGRLKLEELQRQAEAPTSGAEATTGAPLTQAADDLRRAIERLSQRIYDLELTRLIAVQTAPQIRLIQDGDERLANKIHAAVLTTIPLWRRQVALAVSLAHQKRALETVRGVADGTDELLRSNAEALRQGTLDVREETQRGIVDVATLQATTDDLIGTVEDALRISEDGRTKRAEGEKQLAEMEERIRSLLADRSGGDELR